MPPIVFLTCAALGLLHYRVPIAHPWLLVSVSCLFAGTSMWRRNSDVTPGYLLLELAATSCVVWASDGVRSPFAMLYLVFILHTSIAYGHPWGVGAASVAAACLAATQWVLGQSGGGLVDRLMATYPFFVMVGFLTGQMADAMAQQRMRVAAEHATTRMEMSLAEEVQRFLLPKAEPKSDVWEFKLVMRPQQIIGGDFAQFLSLPQGQACMIADVTGHGVASALLLGSLHELMSRFGHLPCPQAVQRINGSLCESTPEGVSVSLVLLHLEADGTVLFTNAGHPYPMVVRAATGRVEPWVSSNVLAGWFADAAYTEQRQRLDPGDVMLLYTDGLSDTLLSGRQRVEEEGVQRALLDSAGMSLNAIADRLLEPVRAGGQVDDVTVLLIRRR